MRSLAANLGLTATLFVSHACGTATTTVDVYGASSLTELLRELGEAFERDRADVSVRFSFAGSPALATQIRQGAPADIYASANPLLADGLTEEGYIERSRLLASTRMVVVVRAEGPSIDSLARLADGDVVLVLAAEGVPAGDYAREVLSSASTVDGLGVEFQDRVLANVRSFEPNVRAALLKVEFGEADAAIVYETDVRLEGSMLRTVPIPEQFNVVATYSVALLSEADESARAFYDFLATEKAAEIIREFGFVAPRGEN